MRRILLIVALSFGTVAGFASGIHHLRCFREHRGQWEKHVADICVDAARRADSGKTAE